MGRTAPKSLGHRKRVSGLGIASLSWLFSGAILFILATEGLIAFQDIKRETELKTALQNLSNQQSRNLDAIQNLHTSITKHSARTNPGADLIKRDFNQITASLDHLFEINKNNTEKYVVFEGKTLSKRLVNLKRHLTEKQNTLLKANAATTPKTSEEHFEVARRISNSIAITLDTMQRSILERSKYQTSLVTEHLEEISKQRFWGLVRMATILALTIAGIIILIQRRIIRPLQNITAAIRNYSDGHFNVGLAEQRRHDEIGEIARTLNVWRQSAHGKATLHKKLERSIAKQQLLNEIAITANEALDKNEAFGQCLKLVSEFYGWPVGHMWAPASHGSPRLYPEDCWYLGNPEQHAPFKRATQQSTFTHGQGLPGTVFQTGDVAWVNYVEEEANFPRVDAAKETNLNSGVALPVKIRDKVVLILEFFSHETIEKTPELVEVLTHIGTQMSRVAERSIWAEEAIEHSDHLQELIDEATLELREKAQELKLSLEKEQELNQLQRDFISMASHEFRTPLAIIDSAAQKIERRKDRITQDDLSARIDKIRQAVKRMTALMESTLSAAKTEAGAIELSLSNVPLKDLIKNVCDRQSELSPSHNIKTDIDNLPASIKADAGAIEQIFTNLLSNAVKYSPDAPDILIQGMCDNDKVIISIIDEGLGIDESDLPKMFTRFFRAKTSTGIAGTGIGLSIVKKLVDEHAGTISLVSEKDKGSTFTIHLPTDGPGNVKQDYFEEALFDELSVKESAR